VDAIDTKIIDELKDNARLPASAIAKKVNLSVPAVLERMKKLSQNGVIERYTVRLNRKTMGCALLAFVMVRLNAGAEIQAFRAHILSYPCVLECHHIAGEYDYLLKVATSDTDALERFLTDELKKLEGVAGTNTQIVLTTLKEG
jgi:Lrp/AsnC family leucine-responsive transcriptional regulator